MTRTGNKGPYPRQKLLIYHRFAKRWRIGPLLTAVMGGLLYGMAWLTDKNLLRSVNVDFLQMLWGNRIYILGLVGFSLVLYVLIVGIGRSSFVEVRPQALRVRAGMVTSDISYGRIRQIRLVQLASVYPPNSLRAGDWATLKPFIDTSCTAVDLQSWPKLPLKRLWHKFMFTQDGVSLLFIVEDAMVLNQQIDSATAARQARLSKTQRGYQDPVERAAEMARKKRI
jgi:hypothetical protein